MKKAVTGHNHMYFRVIRFADFNSEVIFDLSGCLEAALASEAMVLEVFKFADFKFVFKLDLGSCNCLQVWSHQNMAVTMTSEARFYGPCRTLVYRAIALLFLHKEQQEE